jgi:hypothetical protein
MNRGGDKVRDEYIIIGVGRIGSYDKARKGGYSRSRQYWAIAKWSEECRTVLQRIGGELVRIPDCHCQTTGVHYPMGYVENPSHGKFKTQTAANEYLDKMKAEM